MEPPASVSAKPGSGRRGSLPEIVSRHNIARWPKSRLHSSGGQERKRCPLRFSTEDNQAIADLIAFSCGHRAAVADRCVKWYLDTKNDADRLTAAVESFENFLAAVEQLEMFLYALVSQVKSPTQSFLCLYSSIFVKETYHPRAPLKGPESAGRLLHLLHRAGWNEFRQMFGLPSWEEITARTVGRPAELRSERDYRSHLMRLRDRIRQSLRNRREPRISRGYNKVKHGALVLRSGDPLCGLVVHSIRRRTAASSWVLALPFRAQLASVRQFAENTKRVALLMQEVLWLRYGAID